MKACTGLDLVAAPLRGECACCGERAQLSGWALCGRCDAERMSDIEAANETTETENES